MMEEEEHTDRKQQLAMLCKRLHKYKAVHSDDDTDNINQAIGSNSPESCLSHLMDFEKKCDLHLDFNHLTRVLDLYTRVFSNLPLGKHCQNESYARMLVRFAQLKAIQDVDEAKANFNVARSHSQHFAFVHVAHAEFEHSQGNTKRAVYILQKAFEVDARPKDLLEVTLRNFQSGKERPLCKSNDKENIPVLSHNHLQDSQRGSEFRKVGRISDGTDDLQLASVFRSGTEPCSGSQRRRAVGMPGRVPVLPFSIPEIDDDDGKSSEKSDVFIPNSLSRQTSGSSTSAMSTLSSAKEKTVDGDFLNLKPLKVSPGSGIWEEQAAADSTTTLLHRQDISRTEDITDTFNQVISSNSPELCRAYLLNMEKRGNPHTDYSLLTKLKDCYAKVFTRLPIGKHSKNKSYARILVRYAELKGIEDPDEAIDNFVVVRFNCKLFAFVHIAYAQFEASQGNVKKASSILLKAQALNAQPAELLEVALRNLRAGAKQLVSAEEEHEEVEEPLQELQSCGPAVGAACGGSMEYEVPAQVPGSQFAEQPKPPSREPLSAFKMPSRVGRHLSPQEKYCTPLDPQPVPNLRESLPTPSLALPSRINPLAACQTPTNNRDPFANRLFTPGIKKDPDVGSTSAASRAYAGQQPCTPVSQMFSSHTPQGSITAISNETITIKGKQFFILKMIGRGGSSKVYQVLDHKKQVYAVKYVNLEEADAQAVESYKNEIMYLNHLQQYSDQIIKLYDYEITSSSIYMLMECGNLDLNTWLRKRKATNPLERKFYWKNMLEAVHTIHKHGIVHSDLKPANFVIVNASLKLIDFGIANHIQPDVTSIMKNSQIGTLNYMPPEAIKDTSSKSGEASSKISPKGDVWSLGCILYCMTYGNTPFQTITNQITKLHAIIDPSHRIDFPNIAEKDLLDVLKKCLVRNPRERISISELLEHPYLQLHPQPSPEPVHPSSSDLKRILTELAALQSPNSIVRAANNLAKMCNSGMKLDVSECVKSSKLA